MNKFSFALTLVLAACATTGGSVRTTRRDSVDALIGRYQAQLARGEGLDSMATLNGYFEAVRTACSLGDEPCARVCARRLEIRRLVEGWNTTHSRNFLIEGHRLRLSWDEDIDPACDDDGR